MGSKAITLKETEGLLAFEVISAVHSFTIPRKSNTLYRLEKAKSAGAKFSSSEKR